MIMNDKMLTTRQKQILEYIRTCVHQFGYPPSVREICKEVGLSSTSTVHATSIVWKIWLYPPRPGQEPDHRTPRRRFLAFQENRPPPPRRPSPRRGPHLCRRMRRRVYPFPADFIGNDDCFMLIVQGDSMKNAGILEGDQLIVRHQDTAENGEIVVALIDDEATVKRYFREKDAIRLQPEMMNTNRFIRVTARFSQSRRLYRQY